MLHAYNSCNFLLTRRVETLGMTEG